MTALTQTADPPWKPWKWRPAPPYKYDEIGGLGLLGSRVDPEPLRRLVATSTTARAIALSTTCRLHHRWWVIVQLAAIAARAAPPPDEAEDGWPRLLAVPHVPPTRARDRRSRRAALAAYDDAADGYDVARARADAARYKARHDTWHFDRDQEILTDVYEELFNIPHMLDVARAIDARATKP